MVKQPLNGAPCNGCGACCLEEQCDLSIAFFNVVQPPQQCSALEKHGDWYRCGLVENPGVYMKRIGVYWPESDYLKLAEVWGALLGIGKGCDTSIEEAY